MQRIYLPILYLFFKFQPEETTSPGTVSGSPRRFANQGLVYLSEIQTLQDVNELSVKQAKDILAMNRVNFKGVVEKDELLKHVARLWRQEKQAQDGKLSFYVIIFRRKVSRKAVLTFIFSYVSNLKRSILFCTRLYNSYVFPCSKLMIFLLLFR